MKQEYKKIISSLLEMASDEFSNHGCNDFTLLNTPENKELLISIIKWNCHNKISDMDQEEINKITNSTRDVLYTQDSLLMSYFAYFIEND